MSELKRFVSHPLPVSERVSIIYLDRGQVERDGHTVVLVDANGSTVVPVGKTSVLMIGPGVSISHAAVSLCAAEDVLLLWTAEHGVRLYAAGNPRGNAESLIRQVALAQSEKDRLRVAGRIFEMMFGEAPPQRRSIEQLRGMEGSRVRAVYQSLAREYAIDWQGRDTKGISTPIDAALASVNASLYGLCEAVVLALGYSPSIGFVHRGDRRSFVFDVADCVKFATVVPLAFKLAASGSRNMERAGRTACRDLFYREGMAARLVDVVEGLLSADGLSGS